MTYLGMNFKNAAEIREWSKQGKINEYKRLAKAFDKNPTSMAICSMMTDVALILVNNFGLTWDEVEEIELSIYA